MRVTWPKLQFSKFMMTDQRRPPFWKIACLPLSQHRVLWFWSNFGWGWKMIQWSRLRDQQCSHIKNDARLPDALKIAISQYLSRRHTLRRLAKSQIGCNPSRSKLYKITIITGVGICSELYSCNDKGRWVKNDKMGKVNTLNKFVRTTAIKAINS